MSDRLDQIAAKAWHEYEADDVRWLLSQLYAVQQRHREAVILLENGARLTDPLFMRYWRENVRVWLKE